MRRVGPDGHADQYVDPRGGGNGGAGGDPNNTPAPSYSHGNIDSHAGPGTDAYTHPDGDSNAGDITCSDANSYRRNASYLNAFADPHSNACAADPHADTSARSSAFAADGG